MAHVGQEAALGQAGLLGLGFGVFEHGRNRVYFPGRDPGDPCRDPASNRQGQEREQGDAHRLIPKRFVQDLVCEPEM